MSKKKVALIPAAGYGTRIMKVGGPGEKELIACGDRPAINFVVSELVRAGIEKIVVVTSTRKNALNSWLLGNDDRILQWQSNGKTEPIDYCTEISANVEIELVYQEEPLGLGHAVLQGREAIGNNPFLVALPDEIFFPKDHSLKSQTVSRELIELGLEGKNALLTMPVDIDVQGKYGIIEYVVGADGADVITDMIEKPDPGVTESLQAAIGRYVFQPEFFDMLEGLEKGAGGEIQLTDAISRLIHDPNGEISMTALTHEHRFDVGNPEGHMKLGMHVYEQFKHGFVFPSVARARQLQIASISDVVVL